MVNVVVTNRIYKVKNVPSFMETSATIIKTKFKQKVTGNLTQTFIKIGWVQYVTVTVNKGLLSFPEKFNGCEQLYELLC